MASQFTALANALGPVQGEGGDSGGAPQQLQPLQNRTGTSHIPYIRDHHDSLVAWQLLDHESVERAKKENKLIFLHVGYRACHHCRLMDVECFANPEVASFLNASFIPIIVDREVRPDIDTLYMNYVQATTNTGGWPLNVFLTPELTPVFGGTYWPGPGVISRTAQNGEDVLDFSSILHKVHKIWTEQEARCRKEASEVLGQLREFASEGILGEKSILETQPAPGSASAAYVPPRNDGSAARQTPVSSELDLDQLEEAYTHIAGTFDPVYGGFGVEPKFLTPPKLAFLLQLNGFPSAVQDVVGYDESKEATKMALMTLRKIRDSALRDHIGGAGFTRCSITSDWTIPNFEKLIVDNALLLSLYLEAWKISGSKGDSEFYDVVVELTEYLSSAPIALEGGGFVSSEAADSYNKRGDNDMREGGYYLWTRKEFDDTVQPSDEYVSPVLAAYWDVRRDGNVDQDFDPNDEYMNQSIPRIVRTREELSKQFSITLDTVDQYIRTGKLQLKEKRNKDRVRPEIDDKIVTGWNGLVVSALAQATAALKELKPELSEQSLKAAKATVDFIKEKLWDESNGVLYRVWKDGKDTEAFADDYADVIYGLLEMFDATADESYLEFADKLQKAQIAHFYDASNGAFYTTSESSPHTVLRLKDGMDTSLPSTNSVSVNNLFRLGDLFGDDKFRTLARETISAFEAEMLQHPWLFPGLLGGLVIARLGDAEESAPVDVKYKAVREKA